MELLTLLIVSALLATIASLVTGIWSMGQGGEYDEKHSNQLMRARFGFQGLALILLLVALYFANT